MQASTRAKRKHRERQLGGRAAHKAVGPAIYARKRPDQRSGRSTPSCILASYGSDSQELH